jgi:hypothetical protein
MAEKSYTIVSPSRVWAAYNAVRTGRSNAAPLRRLEYIYARAVESDFLGAIDASIVAAVLSDAEGDTTNGYESTYRVCNRTLNRSVH